MDHNFFIRGLVIGFSIAAPVGPIGVLCIRRSLADGCWIGFATGLGAATADASYGAIAGFGLTAISGFLVAQKFWLGLIGGLFLCYLGVRTFLSKPVDRAAQSAPLRPGSWVAAYASTLFLTLTNPMTIFFFLAVFVRFGLGTSPDYLEAGALVLGVFVGSALWWLLLSSGAALLRARVTPCWMQNINRLSGALIFAFGVHSLFTLTAGPDRAPAPGTPAARAKDLFSVPPTALPSRRRRNSDRRRSEKGV